MNPGAVELAAAVLFGLALIHTFSTPVFERLARRQPARAGMWHLLAEVELVFGFWALALLLCMALLAGTGTAARYLAGRSFTEPLFVFAIMVVAGSRPILHATAQLVRAAARLLPLGTSAAAYFCVLALVPLLGSFITEPAAMTLAALMLRGRYFAPATSRRLRYATVGVLFVNVSIGGTLTPFAAPPVLMVAQTWGWDLAFMLSHFGWKAALAVTANAALATLLFRDELRALPPVAEPVRQPLPGGLILVHLAFLAGVVVFAHQPPVFLGLLAAFMVFATVSARHQDRLMLRESLLVAVFLAGLVVLGGLQQWWLKPLLLGMSPQAVYWGATALTAITDNAALTYLGSLVPGLAPEFQYALVAGAVTGGGLTVIANAPNPAGASILKDRFEDRSIHPLGLLAAALAPTAVAAAAFLLL